MRADVERGRQELLGLLIADYSRPDGSTTKETPIGTINPVGILFIDASKKYERKLLLRRLNTPQNQRLGQQAMEAMSQSFLTISAGEVITQSLRFAHAARQKMPDIYRDDTLELAGLDFGPYDPLHVERIEQRLLLGHLMSILSSPGREHAAWGLPELAEDPDCDHTMKFMNQWTTDFEITYEKDPLLGHTLAEWVTIFGKLNGSLARAQKKIGSLEQAVVFSSIPDILPEAKMYYLMYNSPDYGSKG